MKKYKLEYIDGYIKGLYVENRFLSEFKRVEILYPNGMKKEYDVIIKENKFGLGTDMYIEETIYGIKVPINIIGLIKQECRVMVLNYI